MEGQKELDIVCLYSKRVCKWTLPKPNSFAWDDIVVEPSRWPEQQMNEIIGIRGVTTARYLLQEVSPVVT